MKIKQELIDNIVSLDLTREELAKQLLTTRYTGLKYRAGEKWLDELASHYRDNQGDEDYGKVCSDLYKDYEQEIKSINNKYLNQKES